MKDVARHAGVSLKTVSNVVNDWPYVSAETRERVQDAIETLGYRRNQAARSLVTGKTGTIGVIVSDIANPFFGPAIRGCEDFLFEREYNLFLCNSNEDIDREKQSLNLLMSRGVDGVILWGARLCCEDLTEIIGEDTALVTVDMKEEPGWNKHININVDSAGGARKAVTHLLAQGYRQVAHLQGPSDREPSGWRLAGYREALKEKGIPFNPELVFQEQRTIEGGFHAADRALETNPDIDAFFCYNDLMALGALLAAKKHGRRIPEDLAVVGFDDIDMAALANPPLSTMRIDQKALGRLTGELVVALLSEGPAMEIRERQIVFPVELRQRASSVRGKNSSHTISEIVEDLRSNEADNV